MGRRLDVREIELGHLAHRLENRSKLVPHAVDLALGNLEAGQPRYVQYVFSRDRHTTSEALRRTLKRDGPRWGARQRLARTSGLDDRNVRRLQALLALNDLELDALSLLEGLVAVHRDGREVDENVLALSALDEAVALLVREPLDGAFCQRTASFTNKRRPGNEPSRSY